MFYQKQIPSNNDASPGKVVLGWTHTAQYRLCGISATTHSLVDREKNV